MPCMSGASRTRDDHPGSRWRSRAAAARAHWNLRCAVGTTTTRRLGSAARSCRAAARSCRAAARANVVFPAPGVATARKSRPGAFPNRSSAARCQGRSRIERGTQSSRVTSVEPAVTWCSRPVQPRSLKGKDAGQAGCATVNLNVTFRILVLVSRPEAGVILGDGAPVSSRDPPRPMTWSSNSPTYAALSVLT